MPTGTPDDPCEYCLHARDRHLDQSDDEAKRRAGGAHPCLDCVSCKGFEEGGK